MKRKNQPHRIVRRRINAAMYWWERRSGKRGALDKRQRAVANREYYNVWRKLEPHYQKKLRALGFGPSRSFMRKMMGAAA